MKILKILIGPIILITIIVVLIIDYKTINVGEMITKMEESNAAGILTGTQFINEKVGIYFDTPEVDGIPWHIVPYKQQFTRQPTLFQSSKAEFVCMERDNYWIYFILRVRLQDIPHSRYQDETIEEFGKRMRDDYVRETSSRYRENYKDRFIISEALPVIINGLPYYKYTSHDIELNDYHSSYVTIQNGFGYRFFFYGWGEPIDQHYVNDILYSVVFTEPTVEFIAE